MNESKLNKLNITYWDTLEQITIYIRTDAEFNEMGKCCAGITFLNEQLDFYYLPAEELWDDRIPVDSTEILRKILTMPNCDHNNCWFAVPRMVCEENDLSLTMAAFINNETLHNYLNESFSDDSKQSNSDDLSKFCGFEDMNVPPVAPPPVEEVEKLKCVDQHQSSTYRISQTVSVRQSMQENNFVSDVRKRDSGACVFCCDTNSENLNVQHILQMHQLLSDGHMSKLGVDSWNDARNGLTLCHSCSHWFLEGAVDVACVEVATQDGYDEVLRVSQEYLLDVAVGASTGGSSDRLARLHGKIVRRPSDPSLQWQWPSRALWSYRQASKRNSIGYSSSSSSESSGLHPLAAAAGLSTGGFPVFDLTNGDFKVTFCVPISGRSKSSSNKSKRRQLKQQQRILQHHDGVEDEAEAGAWAALIRGGRGLRSYMRLGLRWMWRRPLSSSSSLPSLLPPSPSSQPLVSSTLSSLPSWLTRSRQYLYHSHSLSHSPCKVAAAE